MYAQGSIDYGMDNEEEEEEMTHYAQVQPEEEEYEQEQEQEQNDSQSTQPTQSTQAVSQPSQAADPDADAHLWGFLQPCSPAHQRIDLWRIRPKYTFGRSTGVNEFVFPGAKVSGKHAIITWDGTDTATSTVLQDLSSNGTFINGEKVGKGRTRILRDGNEIGFGTHLPQPQTPLEDYRFVYRHLVAGTPQTGLYAYYDIGNELGSGAFASVKRAMNRETGVWYAVKMIHSGKTVRTNGESRSAMFAREISIMESMDHPNVCKLVEVFFHDDNSINLVLELVEGGDLLEHILKSENGLPEYDARDITYQICDALSYIHARGITHRDMKPENVLLTRQRPPICKIADFGLAKVVDGLTMLRTMCGTPSYLAPEVVSEGPEGYDNLVDSWSVGVILFSMVTSQAPFIEDSTLDIRTRILTRKIDWRALDRHPRMFSVELRHFIRELLRFRPAERLSMTNALDHEWLRQHYPYHPPPPPPDDEEFMSVERDASVLAGERTLRTQRLQQRALEEQQAGEAALPAEMIAYAARHEGPGAGSKGLKRVREELTPVQDVDALADSAKPQPRRSGRHSKAARRD